MHISCTGYSLRAAVEAIIKFPDCKASRFMHKQPVWDMSEHHQTELPAHPHDLGREDSRSQFGHSIISCLVSFWLLFRLSFENCHALT